MVKVGFVKRMSGFISPLRGYWDFAPPGLLGYCTPSEAEGWGYWDAAPRAKPRGGVIVILHPERSRGAYPFITLKNFLFPALMILGEERSIVCVISCTFSPSMLTPPP